MSPWSLVAPFSPIPTLGKPHHLQPVFLLPVSGTSCQKPWENAPLWLHDKPIWASPSRRIIHALPYLVGSVFHFQSTCVHPFFFLLFSRLTLILQPLLVINILTSSLWNNVALACTTAIVFNHFVLINFTHEKLDVKASKQSKFT